VVRYSLFCHFDQRRKWNFRRRGEISRKGGIN